MPRRRSSFLTPYKGRWYFQRRVPADVQDIIGCTRWRDALGTSDFKVAERRCRLRAVETDELIEQARRRKARLSNDINEGRDSVVQRRSVAVDEIGRSQGSARYRREFGPLPGLAAGATDPIGYAGPVNLTVAFGGWRIASYRRPEPLHDFRETGYADESAAATATIPARDVSRPRNDNRSFRSPAVRPSERLSGLYARWRLEAHPSAEYADKVAAHFRRFVELHGDLAISALTRAHVESFRDLIAELPKTQYLRRNAAPYRSLESAVTHGRRHGLPVISATTVDHYLSAMKTLAGFAVKLGLIEDNPARGVRAHTGRRPYSERQRRRPFTGSELRRVAAAVDATWPDDDDRRWLFWVGAYSGARLEEIAQLDAADIENAGGVWVLQIRDGGGKKIKNYSSLRTVPVHPKLLERGFLEFCARSPNGRVFAALKKYKHRWGGLYSRQFSELLRNRAGLDDRRLVFHSLRHRFIDACRNAEVPLDVAERLTGHAPANRVHGAYGLGHAPQTLLRHLARVDPFAEP